MDEEWLWDLAELFAQIEDGMSKKFVIYGHTLSFTDIFVWGALGCILIGFLREIISNG